MRTRLSLPFLVFFIFIGPVYGQHLQPLSEKQETQFRQQSLTVELPGLQVLNEFGEEVSVGYSQRWIPYQGYKRISEIQFFQLTGNDVLARQAQRSRRNKLITLGLGGLSVIAGTALLVSNNNFPSEGDNGFHMRSKLAGGLMMALGASTVSFSAMRLYQQKAPYWIAQDVAASYNDQLLEDLER
ncbi:MAG: hypothetical protein AAF404_00875 [Pseudomonadota bacterium]